MKSTYIKPTILVTRVTPSQIICSSIAGLSGTDNFDTVIDHDAESDVYLSRSSSSVWDDEEDDDNF